MINTTPDMAVLTHFCATNDTSLTELCVTILARFKYTDGSRIWTAGGIAKKLTNGRRTGLSHMGFRAVERVIRRRLYIPEPVHTAVIIYLSSLDLLPPRNLPAPV